MVGKARAEARDGHQHLVVHVLPAGRLEADHVPGHVAARLPVLLVELLGEPVERLDHVIQNDFPVFAFVGHVGSSGDGLRRFRWGDLLGRQGLFDLGDGLLLQGQDLFQHRGLGAAHLRRPGLAA